MCFWVCLAAVVPAAVAAQGRQAGPVDPARAPERARELERLATVMSRSAAFTSDVLAGPVVTDAPFSADATTTVTQILGDGTRIEQTTNARFYRDRAGRVRREQTILGLGALGNNMQTITIAPDPAEGTAFTLDPTTRTARRVPRMAIPLAGNMTFRTNGGTILVAGRTGGAARPEAARPKKCLAHGSSKASRSSAARRPRSFRPDRSATTGRLKSRMSGGNHPS
jgi:hypothetical protein